MSNPSPSRSPRLEDATLRDWVEHWAIETPAAPAVLSEVGNVDYGGLHAKALALAAFLRDLGIGPGDILAVQLPNTMEFVLTYLASGYVGATLQTIHMPYRSGEIEPLLRHSRAKGIVCLAKARDVAPAEIVLSLKRTVPTLQHVIAHGDGAPPSASPFPELSGTPVGRPLPTPASSDRFLLLYTSGTTSAPKGVPIAYRNFLPNAALSARELKIDNRSILLSAAPFSHLYGLFSVKLALATGAATALLPVFSPPALAGALERYRPTGMFVGPAHMAACLNEGLLTPDRMASLKFALISGSTCPLALARAVQERTANGQVLQLWGMSEMQAGTFTRPSETVCHRCGPSAVWPFSSTKREAVTLALNSCAKVPVLGTTISGCVELDRDAQHVLIATVTAARLKSNARFPTIGAIVMHCDPS
jgi:cyclohexanecarboxylate-CoA ligase